MLDVLYRRFAQCTEMLSGLGDPGVVGDAGGHLALARVETNGRQLPPVHRNRGERAWRRTLPVWSRPHLFHPSWMRRYSAHSGGSRACKDRIDTRRMWLFKLYAGTYIYVHIYIYILMSDF